MNYDEIYNRLKKSIDFEFRHNKIFKKNIAIYPFGLGGMIVKKILNEQYGITEILIIDNGLSKINDQIKSLDDLTEEEKAEYYVLITAYNSEIYGQVRNAAKENFKAEHIVDLFPKVNPKADTRFETFRLIAERIRELGLSGETAEAGVYQGTFAKYINLFLREKKPYLFDTFEGFKGRDLVEKIDERWSATMVERGTFFDETSIETVMNKMPYPEQCIIKKGYFPETAEGLYETFCFVSLDMDIYESIKNGLEWFWPRMVKHGVIMIHDYNAYHCVGVKQAVDEFCKENDVGFIPLADNCGSAIFIKP